LELLGWGKNNLVGEMIAAVVELKILGAAN
jgi:hypothetical protein